MAFFFVVPFRFAYFGLVGVGSFISDPCTPALTFSIYFVQDCSNAARISNANLFFKVGRCCSHHIVK